MAYQPRKADGSGTPPRCEPSSDARHAQADWYDAPLRATAALDEPAKKLVWCHVKRSDEPKERCQPDLAFAPFDSAHLYRGETACVRQVLLRPVSSLASVADIRAELLGLRRHSEIVRCQSQRGQNQSGNLRLGASPCAQSRANLRRPHEEHERLVKIRWPNRRKKSKQHAYTTEHARRLAHSALFRRLRDR